MSETRHLVVPPRTLRFHPLLTSFIPHVQLGPVLFGCIIVDEHLAVMAGTDTVEGATTAWLARGVKPSSPCWDVDSTAAPDVASRTSTVGPPRS